MKLFDFSIVTPERLTFEGKAAYLRLPAWEGSMGVLAGHAPALVLLKEGAATVRQADGQEDILSLSGGFAEIGPKKVVLFAETAELAQEIDGERARLAASRAREMIGQARRGPKDARDIDVEKAQAALRRALMRLKVFEVAKRKIR
ncbi:MAG: ATP synthase F1 subunit epsilon [Elusimicrobia bacterium]|nr:ATP synthase F1 subunit epsilon [Elusimicrobiota bacterium]